MVLIKSAQTDGTVFETAVINDSIIVSDTGTKIMMGVGTIPTVIVSESVIVSEFEGVADIIQGHVAVDGILYASTYTGLPVASLSDRGIVKLSSSIVSSSVETAATSSAVYALYPLTRVVDTSNLLATKFKNGENTYVYVNSANTNVGINKIPTAGITLDVEGKIQGTSYGGLPVASTTLSGIVMLSSDPNLASDTTAATSSAVKALYPATQVIDVATANQTLLKNGATYISVRNDTNNVGINKQPTLGFALDVTGQIRASEDITAFSDIRFKHDLVRIPDALSKVERLNGYTYKRTDATEENKDKRYLGVVAQEVFAVLPEAVQGNDDIGLSVAYGNLAALLIEAVKDLSARVRDLEV